MINRNISINHLFSGGWELHPEITIILADLLVENGYAVYSTFLQFQRKVTTVDDLREDYFAILTCINDGVLLRGRGKFPEGDLIFRYSLADPKLFEKILGATKNLLEVEREAREIMGEKHVK